MAPWVIIAGSGLDDLTYWQLLFSITRNHNQLQELTIKSSAELFFLDYRGLAPFSFYDWLLFYGDWLGSDLRVTQLWIPNDDWSDCWLQYEWMPLYERTTYMISRRIHRKHTRYWEGADHRKHRSCIVGRVSVGACLPSLCLAMDLCVTNIYQTSRRHMHENNNLRGSS
jgi:hypothetical protein